MRLLSLLPPHLRRGRAAENSALAHLQSNGLQLVARNYRCPGGELDMVMLERRELVFVEVRYRGSERFGGAAPSVDAGKQRKLRRAGESFLQHHPDLAFNGCRFDVVAVSGGGGGGGGKGGGDTASAEYRIDWIRDAFS